MHAIFMMLYIAETIIISYIILYILNAVAVDILVGFKVNINVLHCPSRDLDSFKNITCHMTSCLSHIQHCVHHIFLHKITYATVLVTIIELAR